jgi:uncharacterized protein (TIGR03066 family)
LFDLRLGSAYDLLPFIPTEFPQLLADFRGNGPSATDAAALQTEPSPPFFPDEPASRRRDSRDWDRNDRCLVRPASKRAVWIVLGIVAAFLFLGGAFGLGVWYMVEQEARKPKNLIVGKWQLTDQTTVMRMTIDFRKDGKVIIDVGGATIKGSYVWVNNNQITISLPVTGNGNTSTLTVQVDKSQLVLTGQDGQSMTFTRVK